MKTQIIVCALILAGFFSGCASGPILLNPQPAVSARHDGLVVNDQRTPKVNQFLRNPAPKDKMIGELWALGNMRAGDLLASVVATREPFGTITLKDFTVYMGMGLWTNMARATITAEIEPRDRRAFTISAEGRNRNFSGAPRNMEIAIERALEDFMAKLEALPD